MTTAQAMEKVVNQAVLDLYKTAETHHDEQVGALLLLLSSSFLLLLVVVVFTV